MWALIKLMAIERREGREEWRCLTTCTQTPSDVGYYGDGIVVVMAVSCCKSLQCVKP